MVKARLESPELAEPGRLQGSWWRHVFLLGLPYLPFIGSFLVSLGALENLRLEEVAQVVHAPPAARFVQLGIILILVGLPISVGRDRKVYTWYKSHSKASALKQDLRDMAIDFVEGGLRQTVSTMTPKFFNNEPKEFGNQDRVSLYVKDNKSGFFIRVGRWALNQEWNTPGRVRYPNYQGIIFNAWNDGFATRQNLPARDSDEYRQIHEEEWNITGEEFEDLHMKPRSFVATRIRNRQGTEPIAVLVLESRKGSRFSEADIKRLFEKESTRAHMREIATNGLKHRPHLVSPDPMKGWNT